MLSNVQTWNFSDQAILQFTSFPIQITSLMFVFLKFDAILCLKVLILSFVDLLCIHLS